MLRDITVRLVADAERRAHEALEASSKAKTEFLSRMSHELRTPLNAVIGFSTLLRMDNARPLSPEQLERVQHVENAGAHLLALVNDVLDLSRIESGEMSVSPEAVQLVRVIEEAATMVSPLVTKAGIEVFLAAELPASSAGPRADARPVPAADVWVSADPVRLRQILVNLLSNAQLACVESGRADKRITVRLTRNERVVTIAIVDNGVGIPAENIMRIFNHGFTTGKDGHGFGLHSCALNAKELRGTLSASSDGPGKGATFELELPDEQTANAISWRR